MENSRGPSTMRNMYSGKHYSLPPKSPFPSVAPFYADYAPTAASGPKGVPKYNDGNSHHQRTSSESILIEEQPSWLDELLDEPETPVRKGHRRSSSDSFTYMEAANANIERAAQVEYGLRNMNSAAPSWGSQDFDLYKDARNASFYAEHNRSIQRNQAWDSPQNALAAHSSGTASSRDSFVVQNSTSSGASQGVKKVTSVTTTDKQDTGESCIQDSHTSSERNDASNTNGSAPETDTKRAKQQFAQRSRVRKLQYIAELERNVQALQAEGSEVSAQLKFLNQQSLILSMENKALKQRLDNLAQEQLIKYLEHEVLEREIGRLRNLYKQQQAAPAEQPHHRRTSSRDSMESQFANLSLKNKESSPVRDAVSGPLHI